MTGPFRSALRALAPEPTGRRWVYVPYDQLTGAVGPLSKEAPRTLGIVLVESPYKAGLRPYHRQKLLTVLASGRHFALEQAARGVAVRVEVARGPYRETLRRVAAETGPLRVMEPAERELREDLSPLVEEGALEVIPHEGFLAPDGALERSQGGPPWRMDLFYRHLRKATGILMERGKPAGGKWSFDPENRKPWRGEPSAPAPPRFLPDAVTLEVADLIERDFATHPGRMDPGAVAATLADVERLRARALAECLPHFGPYEDAMSTRSTVLFHSLLSPYLNLCRVLPGPLVREVASREELPLASREGFVRQILGWREYMRQLHRITDGFRTVPGAVLGEGRPLPPVYWGAPSGLACLDHVVREVWDTAYGHHITRLMVLGNLATLLDLSPRELTDWFWVAYADAYDWVVEPNVLGMATYSLGELFTTKPYVSGAAYIKRMSDYCGSCRFDPERTCPVTPLYWAFLERHRAVLGENPRLSMPYRSLARRDAEKRRADEAIFRVVSERLGRGEEVTPDDVAGQGPAGSG